MTTSEFVSLASRGFGVGFGLGFLLWALSYSVKVFRRSILSGMKVFDV